MFQLRFPTTQSVIHISSKIPVVFSAFRKYHYPKRIRNNNPQRKGTTFAEPEMMNSHSTSTSTSSLVEIKPSKLFSKNLAAQQQKKFSVASQRQQQEDSIRSNQSERFSTSPTLPSNYEFRNTSLDSVPQLNEHNNNNPVSTLPSARLLRKMTYSDALKFTSPLLLTNQQDREAASSRDATTVRLQSYAHHEKLNFAAAAQDNNNNNNSNEKKKKKNKVEGENQQNNSLQQNPAYRCLRCSNIFKPFSSPIINNNNKKKKQSVVEQQKKSQRNYGAASVLRADPSLPRCTRCKSTHVQSLLQFLHVKNNSRKY